MSLSLPALDRVHQMDAAAGLRLLPAESVQCIVTSPPYWGLRDYGESAQIGLEPTPEEYVTRVVEVFHEAQRVLRKDGVLWLNLGDSYAGSRCGGDTGGSGLGGGADWQNASKIAKRLHVSRRRDREPCPRSDVRVAGLKPKDLVGIPWRVALALQADGWYLRSDVIWAKPNPMPESVTDRPTKSHEYLFLLAKSERYYYDAQAIAERVTYGDHPRNGCPGPDIQAPGQPKQAGITKRRRSGNKERVLGPGRSRPGSALGSSVPWEDLNGRRNARSVWTIPTSPYPGAHFATFPEMLPERCIRAGTKAGDLVCDPFAGAGTAGVVAVRLGRRFVGFDLAGGDKDLGGHTANERIANPFLSLAEIATGQLSISGGGAVTYVLRRLAA